MHTLSITLACLVSSGALAQTPIYSNASSNPVLAALGRQSTSLSGVAAPAGTVFHELQPGGAAAEANMLLGASCASESGGAFRLADNFVVPAGGWHLSAVTVYAFVPDAVGPVSPFAAANFRIWSGSPANTASQIVFGDSTTNRLSTAYSTNTYVIANSVVPVGTAPDTRRAVWAIRIAADIRLAPGTYWLDWQIEGTDITQQSFSPLAYVLAQRGPTTADAIQLAYSGISRTVTWLPLIDSGKPAGAADKPQELPFILSGAPNCPADFNGDFVVDLFDYLDFVDAFSGGSSAADFNADNVVDFFDYLDFVQAFSGGC